MSNEMTPEDIYAKMNPVDPRELFTLHAVGFEEVEQGDFIRADGWTRPRRVELVEHQNGERLLFLAEPDASRFNTGREGIRRLDANEWHGRSGWRRFPVLRKVWDTAFPG